MGKCSRWLLQNVGARFVVPTVASAVDLVIQLTLGPDGIRRVDEVVAVPGRVEGEVIETEQVFARRGGGLSGHRLSRAGNRQLNCALHLSALQQVRHNRNGGGDYYRRKLAAGKTHAEAMHS